MPHINYSTWHIELLTTLRAKFYVGDMKVWNGRKIISVNFEKEIFNFSFFVENFKIFVENQKIQMSAQENMKHQSRKTRRMTGKNFMRFFPIFFSLSFFR